MTNFDTGEFLFRSKAKQRPSEDKITTVLRQRAKEVETQVAQLLSVDFDTYLTHAKAKADARVQNPKRFIITVSKFGTWSGTISDLLKQEACWQSCIDYTYGHNLLEEDDDLTWKAVIQAMTVEALHAACDDKQVHITSLEGDVVDSLDTLQATIDVSDGTEKDIATPHKAAILTQLADDTGSIDLIQAITGYSEPEVLDCIHQARQ
ncbi:MAG: hypothetical protein QM234_10700 [Acidobacteriota bacterium]|nr:hypothetical protein [Acidobacteriota bacterium]